MLFELAAKPGVKVTIKLDIEASSSVEVTISSDDLSYFLLL